MPYFVCLKCKKIGNCENKEFIEINSLKSKVSFLEKRQCLQCGSYNVRYCFDFEKNCIAHIDCDCFYPAVEKLDNPNLKNKPIAVGGEHARSVISSACYIARGFGVRSAMPTYMAKKLCPKLIILPARMERYREISNSIIKIFKQVTPKINQVSIDEAFIDLSGTQRLHKQMPVQTLIDIVSKIKTKTGIYVSVGLSYNKFLAKIASNIDKPKGFFIIDEKNSFNILKKLSLKDIHGIGEKTIEKLNLIGINSVKKIQESSIKELKKVFGKRSLEIHDFVRGVDKREFIKKIKNKSIGKEITFLKDIKHVEEIKIKANYLCSFINKELLNKKLVAKRFILKVKLSNRLSISRSKTLDYYTNCEYEIKDVIFRLLKTVNFLNGIRLLGVSSSNLKKDDVLSAELLFKDKKMIKRENLLNEIGRKNISPAKKLVNKV